MARNELLLTKKINCKAVNPNVQKWLEKWLCHEKKFYFSLIEYNEEILRFKEKDTKNIEHATVEI